MAKTHYTDKFELPLYNWHKATKGELHYLLKGIDYDSPPEGHGVNLHAAFQNIVFQLSSVDTELQQRYIDLCKAYIQKRHSAHKVPMSIFNTALNSYRSVLDSIYTDFEFSGKVYKETQPITFEIRKMLANATEKHLAETLFSVFRLGVLPCRLKEDGNMLGVLAKASVVLKFRINPMDVTLGEYESFISDASEMSKKAKSLK